MGIDVFASAGNSSIEALIKSTLELEAQPRFRVEDKKTALAARKTVLSTLDSKLSTLNTVSKKLTDVLTDHFASKTTIVSDEKKFTATAEAKALAADHDVSISRLAAADTRVSKQYTKTATDLKTFFDTNGSQTFSIEVGHPLTTNSSNRVTVSVSVTPTGADNDSIMKEIALAVNNAMGAAVTAKTIDADETLSASVVHETASTSRLTFKSGLSGYTYRMVMTDSANTLLSTMEINSSLQSSGTAGGFITTVGTSSSNSQLNSQLVVDGLTFYRDSNTISDIMDGVTMTIKDVTTSTETLQVNTDTETVKEELQALLDAYNGVMTFLREKQAVNGASGTRGELSGDSTYSFLRSSMRGIMGNKVSGIASGNPEHLFEIGITAASDGTMSFTDTKKFESVMGAGTTKISDLFRSTTGVASQFKTLLADFIKVGGILDDGKTSISDRMKSLDGQLKRFDARLDRREIQLRQKLAAMQQSASLLGGQQSAFASLAATIRF